MLNGIKKFIRLSRRSGQSGLSGQSGRKNIYHVCLVHFVHFVHFPVLDISDFYHYIHGDEQVESLNKSIPKMSEIEMKSFEKGQDKIQKICDMIRRETIEPAKQESEEIIQQASRRAEEIIQEAEQQAEQLIKQARGQIEQERNVFHSSLQQAAKQAIEALRQEVERKFFNDELQALLDKQLSNPQIIADLINAIVSGIEKDGMSTDLSAVIANTTTPEEVSRLLLDEVRKKLTAKSIEVGHFKGGAQVKLHGKRLTLDLSDQTLKELLAAYVRKDFRQLIFGH